MENVSVSENRSLETTTEKKSTTVNDDNDDFYDYFNVGYDYELEDSNSYQDDDPDHRNSSHTGTNFFVIVLIWQTFRTK